MVCTNPQFSTRLEPFVAGVDVSVWGANSGTGAADSVSAAASLERTLTNLRTGLCTAWADDSYYLLLHHLDHCDETERLTFVSPRLRPAKQYLAGWFAQSSSMVTPSSIVLHAQVDLLPTQFVIIFRREHRSSLPGRHETKSF